MSETGPKKTPDTEPRSEDIYHIKGIPDALQIAAIKKMRDEQLNRELEFMGAVDFRDTKARESAKAQAHAEIEGMIRDHLLSNGVSPDDEKFKSGEYAALLRKYSIDKIGSEWDRGTLDERGVYQAPKFQEAYQDIKDTYEGAADTSKVEPDKTDKDPDPEPTPIVPEPTPPPTPEPTPEPTPTPPTPEEVAAEEEAKKKKEEEEAKVKERLEKIEKLEKELKDVQAAKHLAFAARMAVGFFRKGKKKELGDAYEEAAQKYRSTLEQLELLKMEKQDEELAESLVPHNEVINEDLQKRFDALLKSDNKAQHEAMLESGGWKARTLERFANMSKKKKVALLLGAGALLAAGGFALAIAGGIAGGVAAATGGGFLGAAKGSKAYAVTKSRMYAKKDESALDFKLEDTSIDRKEALKLALDRLRGEDDKDIKDADKKKRNAVLIGIGSAALGSGVGTLVAHSVDSGWLHSTSRPSGVFGGRVGDVIAGPENGPTAPGAGSVVDADHAWSVKPEVGPVHAPLDLDPSDYNLRNGAGFYEEFGKIEGIDRSHYSQLLQDVGPRLAQMDNGMGRPLAYEMHGHPGEWGIRMTADHKMPHEAMQLIKDRYDEMFGSAGGGGNAAEILTDTTPDLTATDVNSLQGVIHMDTITPDSLPSNTHLLDTLSYTAPNMPGSQFATNIGLPSKVWLENLQPYIADQVANHNPNYANSFYVGPNNAVAYTGNGRLSKATIADMLTHIPKNVRDTLKVG